MKILGLTGGIASGKSTVAAMFSQKGIPVLCADELAHQMVEPGKVGYQKVVAAFGNKILNPDASIHRAKLGSLVFNHPKKRKLLEELLHPEMIAQIKERVEILKSEKKKLVVLDIPLLYEENLDTLFDAVMVVYAPETMMIKRIEERGGIPPEEIKKWIAAQMSIEEKKKRADYVIDNSGNLENTQRQVEKLIKKLQT